MKKGKIVKFSAATMVALSAITPVAAFANETETTAPGFYTGSTFVPVADFAKLSKTAKKAFLAENIKDNALVLVQNGKVYDMTKEEIQNAPASEVEGLGKTVEEYTAETGKKLTPNGIVDNEAPAAELTVTSVSAINSQNEAVELTAVPVTGALQVKFSEAVTKETVNVNNVRVYEVDGNVPVSIPASDITLSQDGLTATIKLDGASLKKSNEYKVEVKGVKNAKDTTVEAKTVNFKTANVAVVTNAYFANNTSDNDNNAPTGVQSINVAYDAKLSPSTVTTSNVTLVDVATGNKVPLNLDTTTVGTTGNTITITTDAALPDGKQYTLSISGVKTATGEDAEAFTKAFAVNAPTPLAGAQTFTTLDGKNILTPTAVWPKLTAGTTEAGAYNPGLQLNVGNAVKLDTTTIQENVQLVEKVSKAVVPATITYNSDAKILTVVPKSDLKESTDYELQFKGGLKSTDGIFLDATKKTEVITGETLAFTTLDVTAPTVVSVTSKNGESGLKISESQEFTVKLSEAATLTTGNVVLAETGVDFNDQSSITGKRIPASELSVTLVPGTTDTYSVKLKANATRVAQNKAYKLVIVGKDLEQTPLVTTGGNSVSVVVDGTGNKLKSSSTLAFTTEGADVTAPTVSKIYKGTTLTAANEVTTATNVVNTNNFTFVFDEAILDTATNIDSSKVKLEKYNGSAWVADATVPTVNTTAVNNSEGTKVGLNVALTGVTVADAKYRIVIGAGAVKDAVGNKNTQEKVFEFIGTEGDDTAANVDVLTGSVTGTNLTASADPAAVAVNTKIYVGFDENEIFEVASTQVKVTDAGGNAVEGTFKEVNTAITTGLKTGKQYVFTPAADLKAGAVYTVTVEGVKDLAGNTIEKKVVSFKTASGATKVVESSVVDGATNVDRSKTITFKLSAADATLATDTTSADGKVVLKNGLVAVPTTDYDLVASADKKEFSIVLKAPLAANSKYTLEINPTGDTNNNVTTIEFTTGISSTDDVKPEFVAFGKVTGSTFTPIAVTSGTYTVNAVGDDLAVQFSEAIDITGATVALTDVADAKAVAILSNTAVDADASIPGSETLTVNPVLDLTTGKTYKLTVTGVKDAAGNVAKDLELYVVAP